MNAFLFSITFSKIMNFRDVRDQNNLFRNSAFLLRGHPSFIETCITINAAAAVA